MMMLDVVQYKVLEESMVIKKAVYIAICTDLKGKKDAISPLSRRSGKLEILTECTQYGFKDRGEGQDILIASVVGLVGFSEAIAVVTPTLPHSSDQKLAPRCILQGLQSVHGGAEGPARRADAA